MSSRGDMLSCCRKNDGTQELYCFLDVSGKYFFSLSLIFYGIGLQVEAVAIWYWVDSVNISRSVGQSVSRSVGRSVGQSVGRLVSRSVSRKLGWHTIVTHFYIYL